MSFTNVPFDWFCWLLGVWIKCNLLTILVSFIIIIICWYKCRINSRIQWIEFHDESWCPNIVKEYLRRCIYEIAWRNKGGKFIADMLLPIIKKNKISLILDCCSGACGPSVIVNEEINKISQQPIVTILTDLYPQISSWTVFSKTNKNLYYSEKPIDATDIDYNHINNILTTNSMHINGEFNSLIKARTIFGAFHHFNFDLSVKIFVDAFAQKDIIIIGDGCPQKRFIDFILWYFIFVLPLPYATIQVIKFWLMEDPQLNIFKKIYYCLSIIVLFPLFFFSLQHDHIISMARMYNKSEMMEMVSASLKSINQEIDYEVTHQVHQNMFGLLICVPK